MSIRATFVGVAMVLVVMPAAGIPASVGRAPAPAQTQAQAPPSAETPHGAWEFHARLIPNSPVKPIRLWMEVGDRDLLNPQCHAR